MKQSFEEYIKPKIHTLRFSVGLYSDKISSTLLDEMDQMVIQYYMPLDQEELIVDEEFTKTFLSLLVKIKVSFCGKEMLIRELEFLEPQQAEFITETLVNYMKLLFGEIRRYKDSL